MRKDRVVLMGLEADGDSIESYNFSGGTRTFALGIHARNRGAGYVDLDLRPAKQPLEPVGWVRARRFFRAGRRRCFRRSWQEAFAWRTA